MFARLIHCSNIFNLSLTMSDGVLSRHTLLELYGCDPQRLVRSRAVKKVLCEAVLKAGGTIVKTVFHNFSPHGVSGVVVIAESHVTIHTWPEHAYAAVDIFSCSPKLEHGVIRAYLERALSTRRVTARTFLRGCAAVAPGGSLFGRTAEAGIPLASARPPDAMTSSW